MNKDSNLFTCSHCDYNSKWKCNVTRHMVRNHAQQNVNPVQQNVTPVDYSDENMFECDICYKIFNKQWILTRHKKKCTGITNPLLCIHCNKTFASRHSK